MTTYRVAIPDTCNIHGFTLEEAEALVNEHLHEVEAIPFWYVANNRIQGCVYRDKNITSVLAQIDAEDFLRSRLNNPNEDRA